MERHKSVMHACICVVVAGSRNKAPRLLTVGDVLASGTQALQKVMEPFSKNLVYRGGDVMNYKSAPML